MRLRTLAAASLFLVFCPGRARALVRDETLGPNGHDAPPEYIAAAAALGVKWVRIDGSWDTQEPAQGAFNWHLDAAVDNARAAGLQVFMSLGGTPPWVPRHGDSDGFAYNDVPNGAAEWSAFVRAAVAHYRMHGVRHFGLWNEAN